MSATDRLREEQVFHDRQARARAAWFGRHPESLRFDDDTYLDHETWIRPGFAQLGDVAGLPVLDFGCGHGMAAVVLARRGAHVTAFDLSHGYLDEARQRARANEVVISFVKADGEIAKFEDADATPVRLTTRPLIAPPPSRKRNSAELPSWRRL